MSKFFKFIYFKERHDENIPEMSVEFEILKLLKSKDVNWRQPLKS